MGNNNMTGKCVRCGKYKTIKNGKGWQPSLLFGSVNCNGEMCPQCVDSHKKIVSQIRK